MLDAATEAGLTALTTELVQVPNDENRGMAIVKARAVFADGRIFEDYGDASPANCSPQIATAAVRMASTRAKGRVLRDALNVGQTMFEELPDLNGHASYADGAAGEAPQPARSSSGPAAGCEVCGTVMTPAQVKLSQQKWQKNLCPACQKGATR